MTNILRSEACIHGVIIGRCIECDLTAALVQLAEKEGQVCRVREAWSTGDVVGMRSALTSNPPYSSPCRHEELWKLEREAHAATEEEATRLREENATILGLNKSWTLRDTLQKVATAANHLLSVHDCDCVGWENVKTSVSEAEQYLDIIDATLHLRAKEGT